MMIIAVVGASCPVQAAMDRGALVGDEQGRLGLSKVAYNLQGNTDAYV